MTGNVVEVFVKCRIKLHPSCPEEHSHFYHHFLVFTKKNYCNLKYIFTT